MALEHLTTADAVFDRLGGVTAVANITARRYSAAFNWKSFGKFPANTFVVMQRALHDIDCTAAPSLWGMQAESERTSERAQS